jgi:hypothetical protein
LKILILEDCPERTKKFQRKLIGHVVIFTTTSQDCIEALACDNFDCLMLDHDLGGQTYQNPDDNTGYGVVKWLVKNIGRCPEQIYVHSLNGPAAGMMVKLFEDNGIQAKYIPFLWEKI